MSAAMSRATMQERPQDLLSTPHARGTHHVVLALRVRSSAAVSQPWHSNNMLCIREEVTSIIP